MSEIIIVQISKDQLQTLIEESVAKSMAIYHQNKEDADSLLRIRDVCQMLQVSKVTIHNWKKTGLLPFHRISNRIFFKKSEVLASMKASKFRLSK